MSVLGGCGCKIFQFEFIQITSLPDWSGHWSIRSIRFEIFFSKPIANRWVCDHFCVIIDRSSIGWCQSIPINQQISIDRLVFPMAMVDLIGCSRPGSKEFSTWLEIVANWLKTNSPTSMNCLWTVRELLCCCVFVNFDVIVDKVVLSKSRTC